MHMIHALTLPYNLIDHGLPGGCGGSCNAVSCCKGKGDPTPDSSIDGQYFHGTHVSGIIAAMQNNAQVGLHVPRPIHHHG
jgi:hypothetical protein